MFTTVGFLHLFACVSSWTLFLLPSLHIIMSSISFDQGISQFVHLHDVILDIIDELLRDMRCGVSSYNLVIVSVTQ